MPQIKLPKDSDTLGTVIEKAISSGETERNIRRVEWLVDYYYMRGTREFTSLNYLAGTVTVHYENTQGELDYRYDAALRKFQTEKGRLLRLDERPAVKRDNNFTLDGMRKASMAQAVLNVMFSRIKGRAIKGAFIQALLMYGTAGLACWGQKKSSEDVHLATVEVVPPWELMPIPARPVTQSSLQGIMRVRYVPVEWLKLREGIKGFSTGGKGDGKVETVQAQYGSRPDTPLDDNAIDTGRSAEGGIQGRTKDWSALLQGKAKGSDKKSGEETEEIVKMAEVFIPEADNRLARYIVWAGGRTLLDEDYTEAEDPPMMPIGVGRYIDTGDFYGRSFASMMRPTNIEVEYLLKRLFENMQDLDQFGYIMVPMDSGIDFENFKATGKPRIIPYQPDLTVPEHRPYAIEPVNIGDLPGKVANLGRDVMGELAGQGEMLSGGAPGRVDSASGLGIIQEASNIPLSPTAEDIAGAYETVYRAMLSIARDTWESGALAYLTSLDDSLVGVVLDPESGRIRLDANSVPDPLEVDVTIRAAAPQSVQQRKMELLNLLQVGIVTPREFRRISRLESLEFPIASRAEFENYRKAILHNILLFGDGKTPGQVSINATTDNPEIHLEVLGDFMSRPEWMLASKEVRLAFEKMKEYYEGLLGAKFPTNMPYPDEAAESLSQQGDEGLSQMEE